MRTGGPAAAALSVATATVSIGTGAGGVVYGGGNGVTQSVCVPQNAG